VSIQKRVREIEQLGWRVERTRGDHLRLTHPDARYPVFTALTPSDWRAWEKMLADMRRALRKASAA
jgi:hypothetical protein